MKWIFHPKNKEITTSLPLSVEISDWKGRPSIVLVGSGPLSLKEQKSGSLKSDFYVYLPGVYQVKVSDASGTSTIEFTASEHHYLDFGEEFGFFFLLFLIVMGGIILWTKKIMTKKPLGN